MKLQAGVSRFSSAFTPSQNGLELTIRSTFSLAAMNSLLASFLQTTTFKRINVLRTRGTLTTCQVPSLPEGSQSCCQAAKRSFAAVNFSERQSTAVKPSVSFAEHQCGQDFFGDTAILEELDHRSAASEMIVLGE